MDIEPRALQGAQQLLLAGQDLTQVGQAIDGLFQRCQLPGVYNPTCFENELQYLVIVSSIRASLDLKELHMRVCPESVVASAVSMALALFVPLTAHGADPVYHFKDERGVDHFSNVPTDPRYKLLPFDSRYQFGTNTSLRQGGPTDVATHAALPQQPHEGDPATIDRDVHQSEGDMPLPGSVGEDAGAGNTQYIDESLTEVAIPDQNMNEQVDQNMNEQVDAKNQGSDPISSFPAGQWQSLTPMQRQ